MDAVERVEDWLAGMRVDQPLVLTNQQYADLWQLVSLARSNGWQDIEEWLRSVAGLAETPGIDYAAFAELVGKGARGILDRLRGSEDEALRTKVGDERD